MALISMHVCIYVCMYVLVTCVSVVCLLHRYDECTCCVEVSQLGEWSNRTVRVELVNDCTAVDRISCLQRHSAVSYRHKLDCCNSVLVSTHG